MERLTEWNDEQIRHAYYPRCFEEPCYGSGCKINDCPFETAACDRLASYEDSRCEPEEVLPKDKADEIALKLMRIADLESLCNYTRLRELAEADKDGRVVVLPCKGYSSIDIARDGVSYRPDHWNIYLTAYAHGQNTPSGLKVGLFDIGEVERAMQEMEGKKDG
jgi:hypothetical protein|nr:MAG TPA: hypothetical protein [Caudoviricetes sp.]